MSQLQLRCSEILAFIMDPRHSQYVQGVLCHFRGPTEGSMQKDPTLQEVSVGVGQYLGLSVGRLYLFHLDAARWCGQADYRDRMSGLYPTDKESIQKRRGVVPFSHVVFGL